MSKVGIVALLAVAACTRVESAKAAPAELDGGGATNRLEEVDLLRIQVLVLERDKIDMTIQRTIEQVAIKYRFGKGDTVDYRTGTITRAKGIK